MTTESQGPDSGDVAVYLTDMVTQACRQTVDFYQRAAELALDFAGAWMQAGSGLLIGRPAVPALLDRAAAASTSAAFQVAEQVLLVQRQVAAAALSRLTAAP